jgi:hypothetical protein
MMIGWFEHAGAAMHLRKGPDALSRWIHLPLQTPIFQLMSHVRLLIFRDCFPIAREKSGNSVGVGGLRSRPCKTGPILL